MVVPNSDNLPPSPIFSSCPSTSSHSSLHLLSFFISSSFPPSRKWVRSLRLSVCHWRSSATAFSSSSTTWKRSSRPSSTWPIRRYDATLNPHWSSSDMMMMMMMINSLLIFPGVPPPGAGEGGGAEPELSSDTDQLSEGNSGETQDRTGCNKIQSPRDQQPAHRPAGEDQIGILETTTSRLTYRDYWNVLNPRKYSCLYHDLFIIGNFILYFGWLVRCLQAMFTVRCSSGTLSVL